MQYSVIVTGTGFEVVAAEYAWLCAPEWKSS